MDDRGDDPRNTPFLAILAYVLGFMGALALAGLGRSRA